MKYLILFTILIILVVVFILYYNQNEWFCHENQCYRIQDKNVKKIKVLSKLEKDLQKIVSLSDSSLVKERFHNTRIQEVNSGETSVAFTINKGRSIHFCLDSVNNESKYQTLLFIAIHELAHVMSVSYNHTPEFHRNFKKLLILAAKHGIYTPQCFNKNPVTYCGTYIGTTPLQDTQFCPA